MTKEPRRILNEGQMIDEELQRAMHSCPRRVQPTFVEPQIDAATIALTNALIPQLRADQQLLQRAAASNEIARREQQARANAAALAAPPIDIDLYD
jgi:hypothetical protein